MIAIEGKNYPVSGVMVHPETQNRRIVGAPDSSVRGKVNNDQTDAINFYFSRYVRREAEKTLETHRFEDPYFGMRMEWLNSKIGYTLGGETSNLVSFGF